LPGHPSVVIDPELILAIESGSHLGSTLSGESAVAVS
jgi:hypothetical protein